MSLAALGRSCITDNHKNHREALNVSVCPASALFGAVVVALSLSSFAIDTANAYPDQPIKIIVTFPPGGSADIVIRALQPLLSDDLRQTIVIENRAGAGGNIGIGGRGAGRAATATRSASPRRAC